MDQRILAASRKLGRPLVALGIAVVTAGCAPGPKITTESAGPNTYRLKCQTSLPRCLEKVDELCVGTRYVVVQARDNRDYYGPATPSEFEVRSSEALVRCGPRGRSLGGDDAPAAEAKPAPSATTKTSVCMAGATRACVGPGACAGGQTCLPDLSGFTSCDCGSPGGDVSGTGAADGGAKG